MSLVSLDVLEEVVRGDLMDFLDLLDYLDPLENLEERYVYQKLGTI